MATQNENRNAGPNSNQNQEPTPGHTANKGAGDKQKGIEQNDHTREGNNDATMYPNKEKTGPENKGNDTNSPGKAQGDSLRSEGAFDRLQPSGKGNQAGTSPNAQPGTENPGGQSPDTTNQEL